MTERSQVREAITKHKVDQTTLKRLKDEKAFVEAELRDIKVVFATLKDNMRGQVF